MVSKVKKSNKKIKIKTQNKLIKRVRKKSKKVVNNLTSFKYSFKNNASMRLKALINYTDKFGIKKTISELTKLIKKYITDNRVCSILLTDIKNLQKWLMKKINKSFKGGDSESVQKSSSMLEKLVDLSKKLGEQTSELVEKSIKSVKGSFSSQRNKLDGMLSGQVNKIKKISTQITKKTEKINNKKPNNKKPNNKKPNNKKPNNTNFTNNKCNLCKKHCTPNGKVKPKKNININSPTTRVVNQGIKVQSKGT